MFNYVDLLTKPYKEGARGPQFYDCYGMLRESYLRDWNILISDYPTRDTEEGNLAAMLHAAETDWIPVPAGTPRCAVTLLVAGFTHIGYMLDSENFLHTLKNVGPGVDVVKSFRWKTKVTGFFQWKVLLASSDVPSSIRRQA